MVAIASNHSGSLEFFFLILFSSLGSQNILIKTSGSQNTRRDINLHVVFLEVIAAQSKSEAIQNIDTKFRFILIFAIVYLLTIIELALAKLFKANLAQFLLDFCIDHLYKQWLQRLVLLLVHLIERYRSTMCQKYIISVLSNLRLIFLLLVLL